LQLSAKTVEKHRSNLTRKLSLPNMAAAPLKRCGVYAIVTPSYSDLTSPLI
jgi:DNA-binding NarL/FixJ family response regulator